MASILPEDVLNTLLCSICKMYLSYGPTKIHRNGETSCGRCNTNDITSPHSLYEEVACSFLFPCINKYEGCNILLLYKDVPSHEKTCNGVRIACPICPFGQNNQISLLYLIDHYKTLHREHFLKDSKFLIDPNKMSEMVYLFCDKFNNSLFLIKVGCTQDRIFLNAVVPEGNKVVQRFKLNDKLLEPNRVLLCTSLGKSEYQQFEAITSEIKDKSNELISCEFLYDILEKTPPIVVKMYDNSVDTTVKTEMKLKKLPKIYLDSRLFSVDKKYRLSPCKTRLIREHDDKFIIKLKCEYCDIYFWNYSKWYFPFFDRTLCFPKVDDQNTLICRSCSHQFKKFNGISDSPIFDLMFYCRYECGQICYVYDLYSHEQDCELNIEKEFIRKPFGENSYNEDDLFINGNVVEPFPFEVAFYSFAIFGRQPKIPNYRDVTSPEKIIYLLTDEGLKCKVIYKYVKGEFHVRVEHNYSESMYLTTIRTQNNLKGKIVFKQSEFLSIGHCMQPGTTNRIKPDGIAQYTHGSPWFAVVIKEITPNCIVTP